MVTQLITRDGLQNQCVNFQVHEHNANTVLLSVEQSRYLYNVMTSDTV